MKITLIRHAKVDMHWEKSYDSFGFDKACERYDSCEIRDVDKKLCCKENESVFISELSRSYGTAVKLFGECDLYKSDLLNEVPLKSFKDTKKKYPLAIWNIIGRIQWLVNSKRQFESKSKTTIRAREAIKLLEKESVNCYVITHGFFVRILEKELKKCGYKMSRIKIKIDNLEEVVAWK